MIKSRTLHLASSSHSVEGIPRAITVIMTWILLLRLAGGIQVGRVFADANLGSHIPKEINALTLGIPVFWLILRRASSGRIILPYWKEMLVMQIVFLSREIIASSEGFLFDASYSYTLFLMYAGFVGLTNMGISIEDRRRVERIFIWVMYSIVGVVILTHLTPLRLAIADVGIESNLAGSSIFQYRFRFSDSIHPNGLSFAIGVGGIIALRHFRNQAKRIPWYLVFYFLGGAFIVLSNASRGGTIVLLGGIVLHLIRQINMSKGGIRYLKYLLGAVIIAIGVFAGVVERLTDSFYVVQRFVGQSDGGFLARIQQIIATWEGFKISPISGNGFSQAGIANLYHQTGSNFHATQILASYGAIGFVAWAVLMRNMFFRPINWGWMLIAGIALSAYNWDILFPLSVVAYLSYSEH